MPRNTNGWTRARAKVGQPLAVTVDKAAELLAVPTRDVRRAAAAVRPYRHADGSPRWPLRELRRALDDTGRVVAP